MYFGTFEKYLFKALSSSSGVGFGSAFAALPFAAGDFALPLISVTVSPRVGGTWKCEHRLLCSRALSSLLSLASSLGRFRLGFLGSSLAWRRLCFGGCLLSRFGPLWRRLRRRRLQR